MARFFHVDFRGELRAGDVLTSMPVTSSRFPDDATALNEQFPEGLSYFGAAMVLHADLDSVPAVIEQILETIRRKFFEKLGVKFPSRLSSLFATDNLESAQVFRSRYQRKNGNIWVVECDHFFKGDMELVCPALVKNHDLAVYYWQGKSTSHPFWEYLLGMPVRVLREAEPSC